MPFYTCDVKAKRKTKMKPYNLPSQLFCPKNTELRSRARFAN